jgi:hypothetical protein
MREKRCLVLYIPSKKALSGRCSFFRTVIRTLRKGIGKGFSESHF